MILDSLENSEKYESIHPRFKQAFDYLRNTDLLALPYGKIELDGKNLIINVADQEGRTKDDAKMETHNKYIDIQIPLSTTETMGWIAGNKLKQTTTAYNPEKDVAFFADKTSNFFNVQPFEFAIFFPEDGHQPAIAVGNIKKIIVKILL
ncbi:MAG: YhcH/YjgK/YiaL family protein [Paludibacter sp.]